MKTVSSEADIHMPSVAGKFYPDNPATLRQAIAGYLSSQSGQGPETRQGAGSARPDTESGAKPDTDQNARQNVQSGAKRTMAAMLPHAGYIFSGEIAGLTLSQTSLMPEPEFSARLLAGAELTGEYKKRGSGQTFVILGPSHTGRGLPLSVWPRGAWRNPLGDMPVDEEFASALCEAVPQLYQANHSAHIGDHAIEVIVPFLQVLAPAAAIVPVTVSLYEPAALRLAGKTLAAQIRRVEAGGGQAFILTSSDMNHFLPHTENMRQDAFALDRLRALDPEGLFNVVSSRRITMCGFSAASLMLNACLELGASECRITAHTSSGETGRKFGAGMERVVGYAGAIIPWP